VRPDGIDLGPASELRIDCEEDRTLRAVLVGMLPEGSRQSVATARSLRERLGADSEREEPDPGYDRD
jgi:hypothetical protein